MFLQFRVLNASVGGSFLYKTRDSEIVPSGEPANVIILLRQDVRPDVSLLFAIYSGTLRFFASRLPLLLLHSFRVRACLLLPISGKSGSELD